MESNLNFNKYGFELRRWMQTLFVHSCAYTICPSGRSTLGNLQTWSFGHAQLAFDKPSGSIQGAQNGFQAFLLDFITDCPGSHWPLLLPRLVSSALAPNSQSVCVCVSSLHARMLVLCFRFWLNVVPIGRVRDGCRQDSVLGHGST